MKCYKLFNNTISYSNCVANLINIGNPTNNIKRRIIPGTGVKCDYSTVPYFKNGKLELVVQHLRLVCSNVVYLQ